MDLLRLVLARQSMAKLISMEKLLRDKRFVYLRETLYNIPPKSDKVVRNSVLSGDLEPNSATYEKNGMLLIRACFLRDVQAFLYFSPYNRGDLDFWYALGTGIPEIQDEALRIMKNVSESLYQFDSIEDEASVPWTADLKKKFKDLLLTLDKVWGLKIPMIAFGIAGISLPRDRVISLDEDNYHYYMIARVRSELNYDQVYHQVKEVESLLRDYDWEYLSPSKELAYARMGYFYPLFQEEDSQKLRKILKIGLLLVNYDLLLFTLSRSKKSYESLVTETKYGRYRYAVTTKMMINARKCLDDPRILAIMSDNVIAQYRIMAGERSRFGPECLDLYLTTGNIKIFGPPRSIEISAQTQLDVGSIQGISIYDIEWLLDITQLNGNRVRRYAFARGQMR